MDRAEQLSALAGLAADQWGLVTAAQAKDAGLNGVQLLRLTEAGLLENVGRGVYLLTSAGMPRHLEIKVAWLRLQPRVPAWERSVGDVDSGVVSHASACQLHELGDIPAPEAEISVPRRRTTKEPHVRLRTAALEPVDVTVVDGLPVTTPLRTIVDLLCAKADGGHIGGVIAEAERRGLVNVEELAGRVRPFAHRYGLPRTAGGRDLIEHLVVQAGEVLRVHELERAGREGFIKALQMLAAQQPAPSISPSWAEALQNALRDATPPLPLQVANLQRVLRQAPQGLQVPSLPPAMVETGGDDDARADAPSTPERTDDGTESE
ncbi:type IV toxin-antitoxin system AbiEi family antitoxin domain-containing protein [Streptomyces megasporus]|uniref:type IV toxin-antitoxin system AbiEi family antitoxin domain-containing protein n=1 Tax=Streptomyces megasporus TaxID=44060 RepID=UPI000691E076|nr:type IV toxin-antitoxin system AbiEi family antitoxin domain-containing protein [Streptomyces megasporus]